jgi:hypothetical protein
VVLVLRMVSVVLLIMALAAPSWQIPPRAVALVVVRDLSASIDATALQRQATLIDELQASQPSTALLGIVDVASTVAVAAIPALPCATLRPRWLVVATGQLSSCGDAGGGVASRW